MKRNVTLYVLLGVLVLFIFVGCTSYNGMVTSRNEVDKVWANVETQYQRRADLIPNLVETVKAVADREKGTFTEIAGLRSGVLDAQKTLKDPNASEEAKINAMNKMDQAKQAIMNINVENYPNLKFPENFKDLQAELAGTENRIAVARSDYNQAATTYNNRIQRFPATVFAGIFGFHSRKPFAAQPGSENAPKVKF